MYKYYEHSSHIKSKISGIAAPSFGRNKEEMFRNMFKDIQTPFEKHRPAKRINFLSYSYVLHKFCELKELDQYLKYFPLLKSREKLRIQDKIWKNICKELHWKFYPSV